MSYSLETIYRVYDDKEGVFIEVKPHPDCPDTAIELRSTGSVASKEFYGEFSVSLTAAHARLLAKALELLAEKMEARL